MRSQRIINNARLAWESIRGARWRSVLTMSGIIVGVLSVLLALSIGEGAKRQLTQQFDSLGSNVLVVVPGFYDESSVQSSQLLNPFLRLDSGSLNDTDVQSIADAPGIATVAPLQILSGQLEAEDTELDDAIIVASTAELSDFLGTSVARGSFYSDEVRPAAVIGARIAERLFGENVPVGRQFTMRGQEFTVRGVLQDMPVSPISLLPDFNNAVLVSRQAAEVDQPVVSEILVRVAADADLDDRRQVIANILAQKHGGRQDFSVLDSAASVNVAGAYLDMLTVLVAGIALVSLFVGGIGVMNIMLVVVWERTREIGVRKAVGGTPRQISGQFLIEAAILSFLGGLIGIVLSYLGVFILSLVTDLAPVLLWQHAALASVVSVAMGVVFGSVPAFKAARKDPIEALR